jgi:hypothetical protein
LLDYGEMNLVLKCVTVINLGNVSCASFMAMFTRLGLEEKSRLKAAEIDSYRTAVSSAQRVE